MDAAEVELQTPILHFLGAVINILDSGKARSVLSAGGNLTALNTSKSDGPFDNHPIAIGRLCIISPENVFMPYG